MDVKFSKDAGDDSQQGGEKGKQNMLLVVLLVLVAGFGYIYFFTGLIKPAPEQKVAEAPPVVQVVKKPLPSPDGKPAKVVEGDEGDGKKVAAASAKPEPVKVDPPPASAPVAKPAAKPAVQEAAKPQGEVKKVEAPQTAVKKPLPSATAKVDKKPATPEKKPAAVVEKKTLPSKDGEKKVVEVKKPAEKSVARADVAAQPKKDVQKPARKEPAVAADAATTGRWTVLVGNYVLEEAMATDLGRIRKAGCEAYIVPGAQKKTHMNRLLLAEFTDRASAQAELDKLKRQTSDAFIIDSAGMHAVYAGSYLLDERASSEKARLAAAGFSLTLKRAAVSIATKNLTAGSFVDKSAAEDILKKLREAGVKATLIR
jgi:cell division septation protein DedD